MTITLTEGQQNAKQAFFNFLASQEDRIFVLEGYSGTGKTTLVKHILEEINKYDQMLKLLDPDLDIPEMRFTATTNKAAENFAEITGEEVGTIHSLLNLRVSYDERTGESKLVPRKSKEPPPTDLLIWVDEASYMDNFLLDALFKFTRRCQFVLIGDPAQLLNVGSTTAPVFTRKLPKAKLTEVVRQAEGNPIIELSTKFRHTVNSGEFFSFKPDGEKIVYLSRDNFEDQIIQEFTNPHWKYSQSKVLAFTNKTVMAYNKAIRSHVKGEPALNKGDYALCNTFVSQGSASIKTDQLVHITDISEPTIQLGVAGKWYELNNHSIWFMPDDMQEKKKAVDYHRADEQYHIAAQIEQQWIDLRAAYSCTINKSQGSTYDKVFIDLDDVKKCRSGNQIARMLYVAVSRARHHVYLCGDLV